MKPRVTVSLSGFFFTGNPVGRFNRNTYGVLRDEGSLGVEASKEALRRKQTTTTAPLQLAENIVAVPTRKRRSARGLSMRVVVSANYGPQPLVRFYNRFVDSGERAGSKVRRGYRFYAAGARSVQGHIDSNISSIEQRLVEGLT